MTKTFSAIAATFILTLVISIPAYLVIKLLGLGMSFPTVFAVASFSSLVSMLRASWVLLNREGVIERIEAGRRETARIRGYETKDEASR
jgi:hypothetical protein